MTFTVRYTAAVACLATAAACGDGSADRPPRPAPELGNGDYSPASVRFTEIAGAGARLQQPTDLAFNPLRPDELWVVNYADDSVVIVHDASTEQRRAEYRKDGYALHFMAEPTAIAFGGDETTIGKAGTFATCGESRNDYDHMAEPNDFMGITLWSSDLSVFAKKNPNGLGSHLDMLHNGPQCMGLAHERDNVYWAFNGKAGALVKYDFAVDDGIGNDDHSDGEAYEYLTGLLRREPGVPSHLALHAASATLYIADTGHGWIATFDTRTGRRGRALGPMEPMAAYFEMDEDELGVVRTMRTDLVKPSGLEIRNELLYVSDNATGRISAFTLAGELVNHVETGLSEGSLAGIAFGPDGKLYFVDMRGGRVLRIDPEEE
jgi:hypothetical protein